MSKVPVVLHINDPDYFMRRYRAQCIQTWLTDRGVPHTLMLLDSCEPELPQVVVLEEEDAIAFKLRFGL